MILAYDKTCNECKKLFVEDIGTNLYQKTSSEKLLYRLNKEF